MQPQAFKPRKEIVVGFNFNYKDTKSKLRAKMEAKREDFQGFADLPQIEYDDEIWPGG